ncbi:hypothetical protein BKA69DRAFT_1032673 [Paraphysoderma sedebokerense]|nr:hypothetical protein BKA69DRAFT_1032673 [Paraphysoderma sedebokerense]
MASPLIPLLRRSSSRLLSTTPSTPSNPKTAILLMNLGGPATLPDVQPFLTRLFSDPDLIPIPFQQHLAPIIAKNRTPKIMEQYAQIGGGSPIRMWTEKQGQLLEKILDQRCPENAPHKTFTTFRYAPPLTSDTLSEIKSLGIKRAVAFTQYPQYSCSTTGSSLNELVRELKNMKMENDVEWSLIDRWPTHQGLVKAFADRIQSALARYPEPLRSKFIILFSAHSLPMTVVNRGDPYVIEVSATVSAIMSHLNNSNPYRLSWQSKVGPRAWMGPATADVVNELGKKGEKNILLVPVAFTSDHIETLFELDLELAEEAKEHNITNLIRAESLNDSPIFINAMADIVESHMKQYNTTSSSLSTSPSTPSTGVKQTVNEKVNKLLKIQCPLCTKSSCKEMREYFLGGSGAGVE